MLTAPTESAVGAARSAGNAIEEAVASARRGDAERERDKTSRPVEVLGFFGLEPGIRVLDLHSGGGYYSEILSYAVGPDGSVVAHTNDIHEKYHSDEIARRYRDDRLLHSQPGRSRVRPALRRWGPACPSDRSHRSSARSSPPA